MFLRQHTVVSSEEHAALWQTSVITGSNMQRFMATVALLDYVNAISLMLLIA